MNRFSNLLSPLRAAISCVASLFVLVAASQAQPADTPSLLQAAQNASGQAQYAAIDDLGEQRVDAAAVVPVLTSLLASDDVQVRWRSARSLGDYQAQAQVAVPALRRLTTDDDAVARLHAAAALGRIGDKSEETVQALIALATESDARVARTAIAALRTLQPAPEVVVEVLGRALTSNDEAVVAHALHAVVERGADAVPLLNEALQRPETAYLACVAIEEIGPEARGTLPELTGLLDRTSHSQVLIQALLAVASIGPDAQSAAPQVVRFLEFPNDQTVPVAAAFALGSIGAESAEAELRQALASDNEFLQMVSAWSLAKLNPDDAGDMQVAVERLTGGLGSDDEMMRRAAAHGLQMLSPPAELVAPALIRLANDPDPIVRDQVVLALASLGEEIVPRACQRLSDPELRGLAVQVLTQLGPQAGDAVGPLVNALEGAEPGFRTQIQLALAAIGPAAAPATEALAAALTSQDSSVRLSALSALRAIGPGAAPARQALANHLQAEDSFEVFAAAWALARITPGDAETVAKIEPVLRGGLTNSDEQIRLECVEALAAIGAGAQSSLPALRETGEGDHSALVRQAAAAAVEKISGGS